MATATEVNIPAHLSESQKYALDLLSNLDLEDLALLKGVLKLGEPAAIGPTTIDGLVAKCAELDMPLTKSGVNKFKKNHGLGNTGASEGVIGKQTAEAMFHAIITLSGKQAFTFPFTELPSADWTTGVRRFAANRPGPRAHAGCDLYFPAGTPIHAVGDGTVIQSYFFFAGTHALEVDHGDFIVRYGEIQANPPVKAGAKVRRGDVIAKVGHLVGISVPSDMLHFEMYDKTAKGPLTVTSSATKRRSDGVPFMRRKDLMDPTPFLNDWKDQLP